MDDFILAGVAPGGLYSREEIRLLLCDLARQLSPPLTIELAEEVFAGEGLANYFEFHAALQSLIQSGKLRAIRQMEGTVLKLEEQYHHAAVELAKELPRHVRDRALHAAEQLRQRDRREADHRITAYPAEDGGCYLTFRQGEPGDMLMSVTVYAPDKAAAERLRNQFLKAPGKLFGAVMEALC